MRLHDYAASANCLKVRLLLGLLDRPYERVPVDIFAGDTLTDAFAALNPLRETPVLELDDGRALTQSNAILGYLAEGTEWLPEDPFERGQVAQWSAFEQERVMSGVGSARFRRLTGRDALDPDGFADRQATGGDALAVLDAHLAGRGWLVGERASIADLAVYGYAHVAPDAGLSFAGLSALVAWLERIEALPGFANDLAPYPANARPGAGRSIYDAG